MESESINFNKLLLIGEMVSKPTIKVLNNGTKAVNFTLNVNEFYRDKDGVEKKHVNSFRVEILGKNAEIHNKMQTGCIYLIDGYLRHEISDNGPIFKVRAYSIKEMKFGIRQMIRNMESLTEAELKVIMDLGSEKIRRKKFARRLEKANKGVADGEIKVDNAGDK